MSARARPLAVAAAAVAAAAAGLVAAPAGAAGPTTLRLHGVGPLRLGMARADAVATGWLADRRPGCELASPRPVTYRVSGPKAPAGVRGSAEFQRGRLRTLSFTRGVRTTTGVTVGRTTVARMTARSRAAGFAAAVRFDGTFQGTFVTVRRRGRQVLGAFAAHRVITILAMPAVAVCE